MVALVALDILVLIGIVFPSVVANTSLSQISGVRVALNALLPVPILILAGLLPATLKEMLVFWRIKDHLPGCRAFTRHGPADPRIDMASLQQNVGSFPKVPREQNELWYKLYRRVDAKTSVIDANRSFLRFREMAGLSFLLMLLVPLVMTFSVVSIITIFQAFGLFAVQYLLTSIAARNSGVRLVCSVLAEHAIRRVT
ncbi:hypothetical protein [Hydrogenophaga sp. BPS33]|uniref:hypothetical protein n=1 Tax=Hydrogenophaga sp. BPS33 TaxID=2651974 RepID=UPI00131F9727|nr:hypothetical protein [Hydrogenophaga sp. BPS33]QHE86418.1 hypothetical protein F9K07_16665 [Hydrogenophaga sp. BPS33]